MKRATALPRLGLLLSVLVALPAYAQSDTTSTHTATPFSHIVVVIQENRTPDNLFQGLCDSNPCDTGPTNPNCLVGDLPGCYDIQTSDWLNKDSPDGVTQPGTVALAGKYDLGHSHTDWENMCDLARRPVGPGTQPAIGGRGTCKMDGAAQVKCGPDPKDCLPDPQFRYVDNSDGILNPYLDLATQYGWANYMFQTNQGPSFPAHQFLFGGTSAPSAEDDKKAVFSSENMHNTGIGGVGATAGCIAAKDTSVELIQPPSAEKEFVYPCFDHDTVPDVLPSDVTWRYYAPNSGSIWTAPNAIQHICQSSGYNGQCTGPEWTDNVDVCEGRPSGTCGSADVIRDINNCNLRSISWVIPTGKNSDHANDNDGGGPAWVASIVNAVGHNTSCDGNGYWNDTAIFITWDDWGGWYDHEAPEILPGPQGDYQYGFRVPMIVVSAYTPEKLIDNERHDFGSILRYIEENFGLHPGVLTFADERSRTDVHEFFDMSISPRRFQEIAASKTEQFFLNDLREATNPDVD